ncbi:ankyrin repeat domain protein [Wolbachia endosymbiont of Armadillidium vulgare str. wVulC]|nr:ankyrin repeat domain-containing protein [Wolbachia endosymbiont of Armadillidium vulgare]KLT21801.1 ankyrin repeat domain protein [Wolbachia endosymbiont of Armadillidium vulgare str. wVulC]
MSDSNKDMNTELFDAVKGGNIDEVGRLISEGADVNAKSKQGNTSLHFAARKGSSEIVKLLLRRGADVNAKSKQGNTPLHIAAWEGSSKIVELLLKHGADVHAKNKQGNTPFYFAKFNDHVDVVDVLNKVSEASVNVESCQNLSSDQKGARTPSCCSKVLNKMAHRLKNKCNLYSNQAITEASGSASRADNRPDLRLNDTNIENLRAGRDGGWQYFR